VTLEPLDRTGKSAFLARLDFRVTQVTANGEPMGATLVKVALVSGRELAASKQLIGLGLRLGRKRKVDWAAVDQERCLGRFDVFLVAFGSTGLQSER
jgi:hypothetical protein